MINKIKQWLNFTPNNNSGDDTVESQDNDHALENNLPASTTESSSPQVKDADLEFLFYQLLEGVANGWQENRIAEFFGKLEPKISVENWLDWLQRYQEKLLLSPASHQQLASRMILLGEVTACLPFVRAVGDLAYQIGTDLLERATANEESKPSTLNSPDPDTSEIAQPKKNIPFVDDVLSLLAKNPLSEQDSKSSEDELGTLINPSQIMAEIEQETHSHTKPRFSDSDTDSEHQESVCESEPVMSAEDLFNIGLEQAEKGKLEKAVSLWEQAAELNPQFAPVWHNLGSAYAYLERLPEALHCFDQAIGINVNDYLSWDDRGNALFRLKRWQEAIVSWERVIGIKPDFYQAWYHRGLALEKLNKNSQAIASYEKCLSIEPDFAPAKKHYQNLKKMDKSPKLNNEQ